ncbi:hypothetical protein YWY31_32240 [Paenibacillus illinoisensis]
MEIADIKIEGARVNRGYGSIMRRANENSPGKSKLLQSGSIDWDHIHRSEHFYRKRGVHCQLDHQKSKVRSCGQMRSLLLIKQIT